MAIATDKDEFNKQMKLCAQRSAGELMSILTEGIKPMDLLDAILSVIPKEKEKSQAVLAAYITLLKKLEAEEVK